MATRSDLTLRKMNSHHYLRTEISEDLTYKIYTSYLTEQFFMDWGEIWQIAFMTPQGELDHPQINILPEHCFALVFETERGVTNIPIPEVSVKFAFVSSHNKMFPHNLTPEIPLFQMFKRKTTSRSKKNEMPQLQQDPF